MSALQITKKWYILYNDIFDLSLVKQLNIVGQDSALRANSKQFELEIFCPSSMNMYQLHCTLYVHRHSLNLLLFNVLW